MTDPIITPTVIAGAIAAVANLITNIISHIDKPAEERRLLILQDTNATLIALSTTLDALIARIESEEVTK